MLKQGAVDLPLRYYSSSVLPAIVHGGRLAIMFSAARQSFQHDIAVQRQWLKLTAVRDTTDRLQATTARYYSRQSR